MIQEFKIQILNQHKNRKLKKRKRQKEYNLQIMNYHHKNFNNSGFNIKIKKNFKLLLIMTQNKWMILYKLLKIVKFIVEIICKEMK